MQLQTTEPHTDQCVCTLPATRSSNRFCPVITKRHSNRATTVRLLFLDNGSKYGADDTDELKTKPQQEMEGNIQITCTDTFAVQHGRQIALQKPSFSESTHVSQIIPESISPNHPSPDASLPVHVQAHTSYSVECLSFKYST